MAMIKAVCKKCGSTNLLKDACAEWCEGTQRWVLAGTYDNTACGNCENEGDDIIDWLPREDVP